MKQFLPFAFILFFAVNGFSQMCTPDPSFADSMAGVYPLPYDADTNPMGGITDSACINEPYEFIFTAVVSDSIVVPLGAFPLDSLVLTSVDGLPDGVEWACDPPTCSFPKNSLGCVTLFGTANNEANLGDNELVIEATVYSFGIPFDLSFPDPTFFPGSYSLYVFDSGESDCITSTTEVLTEVGSIRNLPNPFTGVTNIEVDLMEAGEFTFMVTDMYGKQIHQEELFLDAGLNGFAVDAAGWAPGIYLYTLQNERGAITQKMIVQ